MGSLLTSSLRRHYIPGPQKFGDIMVSLPDGLRKGSVPPSVHLVDIDEGEGQEIIHALDVPVLRGKVEGRPAVSVGFRRVRLPLDQPVELIEVSVRRSHTELSAPSLVDFVRIYLAHGVHEVPQGPFISLLVRPYKPKRAHSLLQDRFVVVPPSVAHDRVRSLGYEELADFGASRGRGDHEGGAPVVVGVVDVYLGYW